ncbi:hypothetical protein [Asanoa siamensis]|uniref:Uncharacterized protein n=1 Tax=Asanoa siamensis TaxID=926357 RepID=A0ABQ4CHG3_9ACTN|nr:hypothetical protein [Asanoa siamensis]GIF70728.1 hypothetical protein Asi02nite_02460 [Asanoa siamensis]
MHSVAKRAATVAIGAAVAFGASSAAWAWWTVEGEATATGSTGSIKPIEVGSASVQGLYPGAEKDLRVEIYNPNPFPVVIDKARAVARTEADRCDRDAISVEIPERPVRVEPGRKSYTLEDAVRMRADVGGCQGADFEVTIRYSGQNAA